MPKYIFEISYTNGDQEHEDISAETLEQAEMALERNHSIFNTEATYELYDVEHQQCSEKK